MEPILEKTIMEEEERYCFPKYYAYPIEQDYPYEQRIINEYKYNEDWQDYINIVDTEGNDLALVKCKDPYIDNIYMYTETILPTDILNSKTTIYPSCVIQQENNDGSSQQGVWENPLNLRYDSKSYSIVKLNNRDEENITNKSYQSSLLTFCFDLESLPENAQIKGMELKFKGVSNTHADNIYIDDRSFLRYTKNSSPPFRQRRVLYAIFNSKTFVRYICTPFFCMRYIRSRMLRPENLLRH